MSNFSKISTETKTESDGPKPPDMQHCALCSYEFRYPRHKEPKPPENHIIGRSVNGGFICRNCYQHGEHHHHVAEDEFRERHHGDMWAALLSASHNLESKQDKIDFLSLLKKQLKAGVGIPLPYDPRSSAADIDAGTDEHYAQKIEARKAQVRAAVENYYDRNR